MERLKAVVYCRGNTQNELDLQYEELRVLSQGCPIKILKINQPNFV